MIKVRVYWNLRKKCWSIKEKNGKVIAYAADVLLCDAVPVVSKAGQARVRAEGRKNVHAYIEGTLANYVKPEDIDIVGEWPVSYRTPTRQIRYNPYIHDTFVYEGTTDNYFGSKWVHLTPNREVITYN